MALAALPPWPRQLARPRSYGGRRSDPPRRELCRFHICVKGGAARSIPLRCLSVTAVSYSLPRSSLTNNRESSCAYPENGGQLVPWSPRRLRPVGACMLLAQVRRTEARPQAARCPFLSCAPWWATPTPEQFGHCRATPLGGRSRLAIWLPIGLGLVRRSRPPREHLAFPLGRHARMQCSTHQGRKSLIMERRKT